MIEKDFFVGGTVGAGQSRKTDVVRVRKALRKTGHIRPSSSPSDVYDRSLHDSIVHFQRDFGLEEDGIIRSGGPTQSAINIAHSALQAGGRAGYEAIREPFAALNRTGYRYQPDESDPKAPVHWVGPNGSRLTPDKLNKALKQDKTPRGRLAMYLDRDPATGQLVFPGTRRRRGFLVGGSGGGGVSRGNIPIGDVFKALFHHLFGGAIDKPGVGQKKGRPSEPAPLTVPPGNLPKQVPPFPAEPPPDPEKGKEEFDAKKSRPFILPGPEPDEIRPAIFVYPDLSDELNKPNIVESDRKGKRETREFNEKVRDWFLDQNEKFGWEHKHGGRKRAVIGHNSGKKVEELKEKAIQNPLKDFEKEKIAGKVDGRKGSKFPDLSFYNRRAKKWLYIQTVDLNKYGKPTLRELENADEIRRRTGGYVLLIGKPWQK